MSDGFGLGGAIDPPPPASESEDQSGYHHGDRCKNRQERDALLTEESADAIGKRLVSVEDPVNRLSDPADLGAEGLPIYRSSLEI